MCQRMHITSTEPLNGQPLTIWIRHEAIMLQKLSNMLLSSAPKVTYYAFKKMLIIPKIILANNVHKFIGVLDH